MHLAPEQVMRTPRGAANSVIRQAPLQAMDLMESERCLPFVRVIKTSTAQGRNQGGTAEYDFRPGSVLCTSGIFLGGIQE